MKNSEITFQVIGSSGLYTAIESQSTIEMMRFDQTGRELMRDNSGYQLTNGDPLRANDDGTFTNLERRVQRFRPVLDPKGEAKPGWKVCMELLLRKTGGTPFFGATEVMDAIIKRAPGFWGAAYSALPDEGFVIGK